MKRCHTVLVEVGKHLGTTSAHVLRAWVPVVVGALRFGRCCGHDKR